MATDSKYANVRFVSICCDKLDGAREIIEKNDEPRWSHVSHYFMDHASKEQAKRQLGFKAVPFYVVLNERVEMVQKGSSKQIDFDAIPGIVPARKENVPQMTTVEKEVEVPVAAVKVNEPVVAERVFVLDEDF